MLKHIHGMQLDNVEDTYNNNIRCTFYHYTFIFTQSIIIIIINNEIFKELIDTCTLVSLSHSPLWHIVTAIKGTD